MYYTSKLNEITYGISIPGDIVSKIVSFTHFNKVLVKIYSLLSHRLYNIYSNCRFLDNDEYFESFINKIIVFKENPEEDLLKISEDFEYGKEDIIKYFNLDKIKDSAFNNILDKHFPEMENLDEIVYSFKLIYLGFLIWNLKDFENLLELEK